MTRKNLEVRKIPFDLSRALGIPNNFSPYWHHDPASSLLGIGYSYFLEFFELFYNCIRPASLEAIRRTNVRDNEKLFHIQENQHAKYHKVLNEFLAQNRSTRIGRHPRVYDFFKPVFERAYLPLIKRLESPAGKYLGSDKAVLDALGMTALFESQTCASSIIFFETMFDNGKLKYTIKNSENLGILYLLGYHFTEELEHCGVAVDVYEEVAGIPYWSDTRVVGMEFGMHEEALAATLAIADHLGIEVTQNDLLASAFYRLTKEKKINLLRPGFHPNNPEIAEIRDHYIKLWDQEWAPTIEQKIRGKAN